MEENLKIQIRAIIAEINLKPVSYTQLAERRGEGRDRHERKPGGRGSLRQDLDGV